MRTSFVYFIQDEANDAVKIGKANDCQKRLIDLQVGNPTALKLVGYVECEASAVASVEGMIHGRFEPHWLSGEWFRFHEEIHSYVREHCVWCGDFTMSIEEACSFICRDVCTKNVLKKAVKEGALRCWKSGRRRYFSRQALREWFESLPKSTGRKKPCPT